MSGDASLHDANSTQDIGEDGTFDAPGERVYYYVGAFAALEEVAQNVVGDALNE